MAAGKKRMTQREIRERAVLKKELQEKGILPQDKKPLNRKKFVEEAQEAWNGRSGGCYLWEHYLIKAIFYMLGRTEKGSLRLSQEAVAAAKILKIAIRIKEFQDGIREKGQHEYKIIDEYEYIKDILEA